MVSETIFCRYERRSFPASEFTEDPDWGTVHEVEPRHTILGTPTDEDWQLEQTGGA